MSDLIDREAAIQAINGNAIGNAWAVAQLRSLPAAVPHEASAETELFADIVRRTAEALGKPRTGKGSSWHDIPECVAAIKVAVPLVDVEKAASVLGQMFNLNGLGMTEDAQREWSRAILSAGYAGAVSVEDVRMVAEALIEIRDGHPQPPQPDEIAAAKRLLAVVK